MADRKRGANHVVPGHWPLQEAKARFSELVRRVQADGPQHVTVHGREEVVVISAAEFRRLKGAETGQSLIDAMRAAPSSDLDFDFEPIRDPARVRDVVF
ncbi:type II toxin-antitoxin system Phd/YefM family antitoxin [Asticcacaulis sp.]|uniref:type II toxin-antitoxin system Phd/YefM family antitoxin n=1 Tax=Asticcacaulis sp. TaxID=1872648 RepID=UPI00261F2C3F|nr:type II toxin-antitoxin system Phd/YefM family antitoxin [Asticcacaulis sp.]